MLEVAVSAIDETPMLIRLLHRLATAIMTLAASGRTLFSPSFVCRRFSSQLNPKMPLASRPIGSRSPMAVNTRSARHLALVQPFGGLAVQILAAFAPSLAKNRWLSARKTETQISALISKLLVCWHRSLQWETQLSQRVTQLAMAD
jgi:hypothetical protein